MSTPIDPPIVVSGGYDPNATSLPIAGGSLPMDPIGGGA